MRRRLAMAIGACGVIAAIAIVAALMVRSPRAPRVTSIGTISPMATTGAAVPANGPPLSSVPTTVPTAATVPVPVPVAVAVPAVPTRIQIARTGVDAPIIAVGVEPGTNNLEIPDIDRVGWYRLGPSPGETGSAVLVGHVDGDGRPGVFWDLGQLAPGDRITVDYAEAGPRDFVVTGRQQVAKNELPADLFSRAGPPRLALITCGGAFDRSSGHYEDNVVVVAAAR